MANFCKTSWPCDHLSPRPWKIPFDHVIIFRWLLHIRIRLDRLFVPLGRLWHEVPWKPQLRPQGSRHKVINSDTTWNNFDSTFLCKYFDCFFLQELSGGPSVPYQDLWLWHWKPCLQVFNCVPCQMWLSISGKYSLNSLSTKKVVAWMAWYNRTKE